MECEMRNDAELLTDLTSEAPMVRDRVTGCPVSLSRKVIADWAGLSQVTICDYCTGKYNIPIGFWRRVLEHYVDPRIFRLLIPENYHYEVYPIEVRSVATTRDFFRDTLRLEQAHHQMMVYLAGILADGQVDELDAASIQRYDDGYLIHRQRDDQLHRSIMVTYQRAAAAHAETPR